MGRVVMFDVDGCLADFIHGFSREGERLGLCRAIHNADQQSWDAVGGMTPEQMDRVWAVVKQDPLFWRRLESLPGFDAAAVERINRWPAGWPIYFVTSRVGVAPKWQTEEWLVRRGVWRPTVLVASRKGEVASVLRATHAIDDKAENAWCVHWLSPATRIFLLDAPYNRYDAGRIGASGVARIYSLAEFLNAVEEDAR